MTNRDFVSPCGLYCGVCAIHIAARDNNTKLKERLVNLYQGGTPDKGTLPNSESLTIEDIHCGGCLSDDLFMHCRQCGIRACTKEKGFQPALRGRPWRLARAVPPSAHRHLRQPWGVHKARNIYRNNLRLCTIKIIISPFIAT